MLYAWETDKLELWASAVGERQTRHSSQRVEAVAPSDTLKKYLPFNFDPRHNVDQEKAHVAETVRPSNPRIRLWLVLVRT